MRVPTAALPLLAGLAVVDAQINFGPVVKVAPAITTNTPYTTNLKGVNTAYTASSILSSLESAHNAGQAQATSSSTSSTTKKTTTPAKKTTSTTKKATSTAVAGKNKKVTTTANKKTSTTKKAKAKKSKVHARDLVLEERAATSTSTQVCTQTNTVPWAYQPTPNTPAGFLADSSLANTAAAAWLPPAGYWTSFQNSYGANDANVLAGYYGGYRLQSSYNISQCAAVCNADPQCQGFNIYFEREPTYVPNNTTCTNPVSAVDIHCALWHEWIYNTSTVNYGIYEYNFVLLTAGSNGYNKLTPPASVANFSGPTALVAAVNPSSVGSALLSQTFYQSFDPLQCANACTTLNQNNRASAISKGSATYQTCTYFNTFNVTYGASSGPSDTMGSMGTSYGMYCQLFTTSTVASSATLNAATYNGVQYNLTGSNGYAMYPPDKGYTNTSWAPAPTGSAAACSNLGSVGSTLVDYNGANYTLACGYDVSYTEVSSDIGNAAASDFYSCFNLCDNFSGCSAFSWYNNICYFKNLTNATVTPQYNPAGNVDFAYLTNKYAGFGASTIPATVTFTTTTIAWTGSSTFTTTSIAGLTATVIVETPGAVATATGTQTVYLAYDQGTQSTVATVTTSASAGASTVTVIKYYPTPVTTCGNAGINFAGYKNLWPGGQNTASYPAITPEVYKTIQPTIYATPTVTTFTSTTAYATSTVTTNTFSTNGYCWYYGYYYRCSYQTSTVGTSTYTTTSTSVGSSTVTPTLTPTGITNYLAESNSGSTGITVYGDSPVDGTVLALDHTFYLFAGRGTGYYSFNIPYTDDAQFVWFGANAVSGWTRNNAAISQFWSSQNTQQPQTLAFFLNVGTYMPVRVFWANGGGPGELHFNVYAPDGSIMLASSIGSNSGYMSPDIVTSPCNASLGAAFPSWGAET